MQFNIMFLVILCHTHLLTCIYTFIHASACFLTNKPCGALIKVSCLHPLHALSETGTFIGVGVGVGVFLLLLVLTLVAIILVAVVVRRKVTYEQKGDTKMEVNPYYNNYNVLVAKQGNEMEEKGLGAGHGYDYVDKNVEKVETVNGFDPYEDVDGKAQIKTAMKQAPKEFSTPVSVTNIGDLYAVVDKSQKKRAEKEKETATNKEDLYAMPMKKKGKLTERWEGVVESEGVEKEENNKDMAGVMYEPTADSGSVQQIEEDSKAQNVDILYAVVDKRRKMKNEN